MILDLLADGSINLTTVRVLAPHLTAENHRAALQRPVVVPLSPDRYRVQFTVGKETQEKLRRVQDLLRREIPDGDLRVIFDRAVTLLLKEAERRTFAETTRDRAGR